jgi:RNA polymerase sigma factor (sigma-70 family)
MPIRRSNAAQVGSFRPTSSVLARSSGHNVGQDLIVGTVSIPAERRGRLRASKRLLALAGDERLVDEIRKGNEAAFAVAFERHGRGVLSFCRHMVGSQEEAEDAVQHTFAAAWVDLQRSSQPVRLKPWLYTIARNRCISLLRARRESPAELDDAVPTAGLSQEVDRRADVRALLADLRELPDEQRAALVLSEVGGLSHADIAQILGRGRADVKALVFRARSTLADWREARETPCEEIREQLSVLSGGALRRRTLRRHLRDCPGCRSFREHVKAQRSMLALALPVVPSAALKSSVLAAAGVGGAAGAGGAVAGGGAAVLTKVVVAGVIATGAVTVGERAIDPPERATPPPQQAAPTAPSAEKVAPRVGVPNRNPAASERSQSARDEASQQRAAKRQAHGKARGHRQKRNASTLAPPQTPVKARGLPPALGRVMQGRTVPTKPDKPTATPDRGRAPGSMREREARPLAPGQELRPPRRNEPPELTAP